MNGKLSFLLVITGFFCFGLCRLRLTWEQGTRVTWSLSSLVRLQSYKFSTFEPEFVGLDLVWKWPVSEWCPIRACLPLCLRSPGSSFPGTGDHMLRSWLWVWLKLEESRGTNPSQFVQDFLSFSRESPGKTRMVGLPRRVRIISALFPAGLGWKRLRGSWTGLT